MRIIPLLIGVLCDGLFERLFGQLDKLAGDVVGQFKRSQLFLQLDRPRKGTATWIGERAVTGVGDHKETWPTQSRGRPSCSQPKE